MEGVQESKLQQDNQSPEENRLKSAIMKVVLDGANVPLVFCCRVKEEMSVCACVCVCVCVCVLCMYVCVCVRVCVRELVGTCII